MIDILSLSPEELRKTVQELGLPGFRAKQISEWLARGCRDFSEMSNLPKSLRETLPQHFELTAPTLLRRQITNRFIRSFLYYVPYVTLSVMTFPAITEATKDPVAGYAALIVGILVAWFRKNLFETAVMCCLTVFILEYFL